MRKPQPISSSTSAIDAKPVAVNSLILLGSPHFDSIGILYEEARKELREGSRLFLLDAIEPGLYPDLNTFTTRSAIFWRTWRRRQFLKGLGGAHCQTLGPLLSRVAHQQSDYPAIVAIARRTLHDHAVCSGIPDTEIPAFVKTRLDATIKSYSRIRVALNDYIDRHKTTRVITFNGRNPVSQLLESICIERGIEIFTLEYFGKRNGKMTYVRSPVDIFDMDKLGDWILDGYMAAGPERDAIAKATLDDRFENLDPLLHKWNVERGTGPAADATPVAAETKPLISFFFSSEDEYPAMKPSRFGLPDPSRQYDTFRQICRGLAERGLLDTYRWEMKLHPRYVAESRKLAAGMLAWKAAIADVRAMGMDIKVQTPTASPYALIARSALVVSYGTTAWEACYLGKPAVLLGPVPFGSHDCAYDAPNVETVLDLIANIPPPKPRDRAYPYAWGWSQIGIVPEMNLSTGPVGLRAKLTVPLRNRFPR